MKDVDVMRDMSHCIKHECAICPRFGQADCTVHLMQDANCVMKMQFDALKDFSEAVAKLKEENARLEKVAPFKFDEKLLVKTVNDIVHYCLDNDEDEEGNEYINLIHAMLEYTRLLPSKYKLVLRYDPDAPEIQLDN